MSLNKFSNIAKNMTPGTFAILNNGSDASGYNSSFTFCGGETGVTLYSFSWKCVYDPLWHRVLHLGAADHPIAGEDNSKFACYELDYDKWSLLPYTQHTLVGNLHCYGLQAFAYRPGAASIFFRIPGNQNNLHSWEMDHKDPATVVYQGQVYPPPGATTADAGGRGSIEYFPDRDELIFHHSQLGYILKKPYVGGSWTNLVPVSTPEGLAVQYDGVGLLYHPVGKCVVWGGGSKFTTAVEWNTKWWRYDSGGGTPVRLDDFNPGDASFNGLTSFGTDGGCLLVADPGSQKYLVIQGFAGTVAVRIWQLDPYAVTGSQWSRVSSSIEAAWPADLFGSGYSGAGEMTACAIPEYNVILFLAYNKTWLYKHSAGQNYAQKAAQKGVLSSHPFASQSEIKYTWQNPGTAAVAPTETYLATKGSGIGYTFPYPFSLDRLPGEGNCPFGQQPITGSLSGPEIDGANGLRWTIPSRSYEGQGSYSANIDDILHSSSAASAAIYPGSPLGRVIYIQSKVKADANFWSTQFRKSDPFDIDIDNVSNPGLPGASCLAGSDILAVPPTAGFGVFSSAYVGKELAVISGGGGFVPGFYFITQFIDAQHVRLSASPAPSAAGYAGAVYIEGTIDHGFGFPSLLDTVKLYVITGNPPNYGGSTSFVAAIEVRRQSTNVYHHGPHFITGTNGQGPNDANFNSVLAWNETDYNELTFRIEVGAVNVSTGWRITWWLNGIKYDPETDWYDGAAWSGPSGFWYGGVPPLGFGWFQIAIQMTHKDATQVHPVCQVWVKDVIISTQPIQMNSVTTSAPTIPAAPGLPWQMR